MSERNGDKSIGIALADALRAGDKARQQELLRELGVDKAIVIDTRGPDGAGVVYLYPGIDPDRL